MDEGKLWKLEAFRHLNQYAKKCECVFAGSSLMEQFPISEILQDLSFPYTIYNRGVGGFSVAELASSLLEECIFSLEPSTLLLSIGTNDLNGPLISLDGLEREIKDLIGAIRSVLPSCRIVWLLYYPVNPACSSTKWAEETLLHRTNSVIDQANSRMRTLMEGEGIEVLDVNDLLVDEEGNLKREYTVDGIHMHAEGYMAIVERVLSCLAL